VTRKEKSIDDCGFDPARRLHGFEEILDRAQRESRVLVTLDKDSGELAIVRGQERSGIVKLVALSATR
jgi:predicted nuclease of predicted toxin-antitoxin system